MDFKKIVLFGRPAVGKTTIEKVFFEGVDPATLIDAPLPPTVGVTTTAVPWLDLTVSVFDHPGQYMARAFQDEAKLAFLLEQALAVVYILDCTRWNEDRRDIEADVDGIIAFSKQARIETNIVVFCHKVDLVREDEVAKIRSAIGAWKTGKETPVHLTSIAPGFLHLLHDAFFAVLSSASGEASYIKGILDKHMAPCKRTLCFISDAKNAVLALASTPDFRFSLLHPLPGFFSSLMRQFEAIKDDDKVDHVILSSRKRTRMDFRCLELFTGIDRHLIIVSEDLNPIAIHKLSDSITDELRAALGNR